MKLLMAIVRDDYAADVTYALNAKDFSVTRISSTGGFWRRGNVTLMVGLDDERIDEALQIIDQNAGPEIEVTDASASHPPRRATIFVIGVSEFAHY
ncbi:MAG: cyclic-di-AMP receptor [Anaerolineae bacterium]|nr:cyclic-di-AMP receptor [Anaerolineae bacterium]